ncbi:hypothetical protein CAPTEDRAFT_215235 [Capitella teleta]|uniref:Uncharacterized protein n=1 Tax=Capitella teleta TaxID=283909 RepID=R7VKK7_CAPTE|nr:hypothetical protein CAPTEDRAFT_215235 [Capitella teleta]|eukprot:ELU17461.1 hypothetical protein CAPTEDRAFT_215235 [Capitella teleta]
MWYCNVSNEIKLLMVEDPNKNAAWACFFGIVCASEQGKEILQQAGKLVEKDKYNSHTTAVGHAISRRAAEPVPIPNQSSDQRQNLAKQQVSSHADGDHAEEKGRLVQPACQCLTDLQQYEPVYVQVDLKHPMWQQATVTRTLTED